MKRINDVNQLIKRLDKKNPISKSCLFYSLTKAHMIFYSLNNNKRPTGLDSHRSITERRGTSQGVSYFHF